MGQTYYMWKKTPDSNLLFHQATTSRFRVNPVQPRNAVVRNNTSTTHHHLVGLEAQQHSSIGLTILSGVLLARRRSVQKETFQPPP